MNQFAFSLGQKVSLSLSRERGEIIGRSEYRDLPPVYWVRYVAADGRQVEGWFDNSALDSEE